MNFRKTQIKAFNQMAHKAKLPIKLNFIQAFFVRRTQDRINRLTLIFGSCHVKVSPYQEWNLLRFIFGPLRYEFMHHEDFLCRCDWRDCENLKKDETGGK